MVIPAPAIEPVSPPSEAAARAARALVSWGKTLDGPGFVELTGTDGARLIADTCKDLRAAEAIATHVINEVAAVIEREVGVNTLLEAYAELIAMSILAADVIDDDLEERPRRHALGPLLARLRAALARVTERQQPPELREQNSPEVLRPATGTPVVHSDKSKAD